MGRSTAFLWSEACHADKKRETLTFPMLKISVVPRIASKCLVLIYRQGMGTAATKAADDAIDRTFFNVPLPRTGFSGTTIVSPGPTA